MKRTNILFIFLMLFAGIGKSQETHIETCFNFRMNSSVIEPSFAGNGPRMEELMDMLRSIRRDSTVSIVSVSFNGTASPDGNAQLNRRLAGERLHALENRVRQEIELPDRLITRNNGYIPWEYLKTQIAASDWTYKEVALRTLGEDAIENPTADPRILQLKQLEGGQVWQQLNERFFSQMRNACVVFITYKKELPPPPTPEPVVAETDTVAVEPMPEPIVEPVVEPVPTPEEPMRHWYVKTNTVGWAMLIGNIALEIDLDEHWSFTFPVYYSALNYFTSDVKFRTTCMQPEVRYWLRDDNQGWFGGAHLGLAWYNYAKGGDWRYQDHNRHTPAYGGGIGGGYRKAISRDGRWLMEFTLGVGAYRLHYDVFHNEHNGAKADERKRTFYGIDNVAVSFAYRFDWKKKGGRK